MIDVFLPFQIPASSDEKDDALSPSPPSSSPSAAKPSRSDLLSQIDQLKQSVETSPDQRRLLDLSEKIHKAIIQLTASNQAAASPAKKQAAAEAHMRRQILFAYAAQQRLPYYQKLVSYFESAESLLNAPEKLLRAHGIPEKSARAICHPQRQRDLMSHVDQCCHFMMTNGWHVLSADDVPPVGNFKAQQDQLPAIFMIRGQRALIDQPKVAIMGDKSAMPSLYAGIVPTVIEALKHHSIIGISNLIQQSSLQFALQSVRLGSPCAIMLGFDIMKSVERRYRYLNYFVDHGCLLVSTDLPFFDTRPPYLQVFKLAMTLSKALFLFPKALDACDYTEYRSKYWPVIAHCQQEDKVCLLYESREDPHAAQAFKSWESQDANVVVYEGLHSLKLLLQNISKNGSLSSDVAKKLLGQLSQLTIIH